MRRLTIGGVVFELDEAQVQELREQLEVDAPAPAVDVKTMARRIGRSADYVYSHARQLGGEKIGGVWVFGLNSPPRPLRPQQDRTRPRPRQRNRREAAALEPRGSKPV